METPIIFPDAVPPGTLVEATDVTRTWMYDKNKNCYRLVAFDYTMFTSGAPITVDPNRVRVHHDFDMNNVTPA